MFGAEIFILGILIGGHTKPNSVGGMEYQRSLTQYVRYVDYGLLVI